MDLTQCGVTVNMAYRSKYFTPELDAQLIDLVRQNSVLYDLTHKNYKVSAVTVPLWRKIATTLNRDVDKCQIRWKSIRATYRRNKKKVGFINTKMTSDIESQYFTPNLTFLDRTFKDQILKTSITTPIDHKEERRGSSSSDETHASTPGECDRANNETQSEGEDDDNEDDSDESDMNNSLKRRMKGHKVRDKRSKTEITSERKKRKDQRLGSVDEFFASMADTVKRFPPQLISEAKFRVCQVVTQLEDKAHKGISP